MADWDFYYFYFMNIEKLYSLYLQASGVSTDTRNITDNSMFFALKGSNFNGNTFAEKAIESGARIAIVDEKEFENEENNIFLVSDALTALQDLARFHRSQLKIPFIGLTGSNGKTTTKELIAIVLEQKYNVIATKGNLNNHIGVPLTVLSVNENHEVAIIEMGANHQKEIEFLTGISKPDFGYITNFGRAHLEGFGGIEGVIKGKSELYTYLRANSKTAFVNSDDSKQMELTNDITRISFGTKNDPVFKFDYKAIPGGYCPEIIYKDSIIKSTLVGEYNAPNVAAAVAVGLTFHVPTEMIQEAIHSYTPDNNRSQILVKGNQEIIMDAYNANPSSMEAALKNFSNIQGDKTVILGDMFELGETSLKEHQRIAGLAAKLNFEKIYLIGETFSQISNPDTKKIKLFSSRGEAENYLSNNKITEKNVLVKGSRGMALEKLIKFLWK